MRTKVVCALADVVATKLGIILNSSFSAQILFSQKGFAYDFEFVHAFLSNKQKKCKIWVSEDLPRRTHISPSCGLEKAL